MFSTDIEKYRQNLIALTNSSNLTIGCAYYVAKDFFKELERAYLQDLRSCDNKVEKEEITVDNFETTHGSEDIQIHESELQSLVSEVNTDEND